MAFQKLIDCETLIVEVEKRPPLYDLQLKEYSDKYLKQQLWGEVCEAVVSDWNNLSLEERSERGKQVHRRWKNLRECFRREFKMRKSKAIQGATSKKKYIYFDHLLFLAKTYSEEENLSNYSPPQSDQDEERLEGDTPGNYMKMEVLETPQQKRRKTNECLRKSHEREMIDLLIKKMDECDEDKAFLMSLLPKFKKFNDEQRFEAQMEIMKVMRKVQLMTT